MHDLVKWPNVDWPMPALTRVGQEAFWDRQASSYGGADMTTDNIGELALVRGLCEDFVTRGYECKDIVTLGGANACRDPVVATEVLARHGHVPTTIHFNDLSARMVDEAMGGHLAPIAKEGAALKAYPGPIHEVVHRIPAVPRRVILGVYSAEAFVVPNPQDGFPYCGLHEYVRNSSTLGDRFLIEPLQFVGDKYESVGPVAPIIAADKDSVASGLEIAWKYTQRSNVDVIRVIGEHRDRVGFFLSHWFSENGIRNLLQACFAYERMQGMTIQRCAKGFVISINPIEPPQGIVTMLNNVLGNILPHEQATTLKSIHALSNAR